MHTVTSWRNINVGPIHYSTCDINGSWHWWWGCWKTFHDISIEFRKIFHRWEWWQWDYMMNVDENMDDLKDYAGTTCILDPWNPPISWRHVSYQTMSNFDTYRNKLKEFERWPHSPLSMQGHWIMALVVGFLNGWRSMTFQESFDKHSIDRNGEWR